MRVRKCLECGQPMRPVKGLAGVWECSEHGDWYAKEKDENAGPPSVEGEARRPFAAFGGQWNLRRVTNEETQARATAPQTIREEIALVTLDVLYDQPLPPVVQAPNKGGKGGKPGRGSRSKSRKRKKQNKKKKRERTLADYQ